MFISGVRFGGRFTAVSLISGTIESLILFVTVLYTFFYTFLSIFFTLLQSLSLVAQFQSLILGTLFVPVFDTFAVSLIGGTISMLD